MNNFDNGIKNNSIMQEKLKSEGKYLFCGKTFAKAGINRHLRFNACGKFSSYETVVSLIWNATMYLFKKEKYHD